MELRYWKNNTLIRWKWWDSCSHEGTCLNSLSQYVSLSLW